jgi:hypothetical protein
MRHALRLDLVHSGSNEVEHYHLVGIRNLGTWLRPIARIPAPYGEYRWIIQSIETGKTLASEGFSPLFAEWQTTAEARETGMHDFQEYFHIPKPNIRSQFLIQRRNPEGTFHNLFETTLDPSKLIAELEPISSPVQGIEMMEIMLHGSAADHIDILILGDGYTSEEKEQFRKDSHLFQEVLFSVSPYKERVENFNMRSLFVPSIESGITDPIRGVYRNTVFGSSYNSLGIDRYLLPRKMEAVYNACAHVPWDTLVILCNSGKFGGGGLYGQYACLASRSDNISYLAVHEFAHSFAGLADEYYTAPVTYETEQVTSLELWEPNVSKLDEQGYVKWQQYIETNIPVPTPWEKEAYEGLMREYEVLRQSAHESSEMTREWMHKVALTAKAHLQKQVYYNQVGAFEGARYQSNGFYRPEVDCLMFSRIAGCFCQVCQDVINDTIDANISINT